eukprot:scaffold210536_cov18-Tisochrysis_lutea.AAC.1
MRLDGQSIAELARLASTGLISEVGGCRQALPVQAKQKATRRSQITKVEAFVTTSDCWPQGRDLKAGNQSANPEHRSTRSSVTASDCQPQGRKPEYRSQYPEFRPQN